MEGPLPATGTPARKAAHILSYAYNRLNSIEMRRGESIASIDMAHHGLRIAEWTSDADRMTQLETNLGSAFYQLNDMEASLAHFKRALELAEQHNFVVFIPMLYGAVGSVLALVGDAEGSLRYAQEARRLFDERGDRHGAAGVIHNIGGLYHDHLGDLNKAVQAYEEALALNRESANIPWLVENLAALGTVFRQQGRFEDALKYYGESLDLREQHDLLTDDLLVEIAALYTAESPLHDEKKAEAYLQQAIEIRRAHGNTRHSAHLALATLYERQERYQESLALVKAARDLERESTKLSIVKQTESWKHQRDLAERERQESIVRAEAAATRRLLDTVLPAPIAQRMIGGEERIADSYENVSILFADLVGFTTLSKDLPAETVIILLNHIFDRFDEIIERNGCEKVKTIGDGYLAVAGAPEVVSDHVIRLAKAALEMSGEIPLPDEIRRLLPNGTRVSSRIGLHCGPVVCGVIGRQRVVWDVYSDAVNTASRMESSGEPGRIHVSEAFATALQAVDSGHWTVDNTNDSMTNGSMTLVKRGTIDVKGKGLMTTYWLEGT
jgi:class 3 adenylate cyclase